MTSFAVAVGRVGQLGHLGHRGAGPRVSADSELTQESLHETVATVARTESFRPDIEGLRGIAIALVLLFHSGLLPLPGGFVGVDVFFVISGFLITGLLLRERERTGRIGLAGFYARRVRRLLPAALVAVAVILPIAAAVVAPLDRPSVSLDGAAAVVSVANVRFAAAEGDYFTALASPSPFTHFWSLGVEEQFYLVWPALLLLGARGRRPRLGAGLVLGGVLVASFAACLVVTEVAPSWAFYMLPTRAWQLATGGLLAIGATSLARLPNLPMAGVGWAGLGAVLSAALVLDSTMAYPGLLALLPTLGAAALIAAGERRWSPAAVLAVGPLRFLGRISYSLYLWHWPILVLPLIAVGAPLSLAVRIGLVVASILVATLSWACVEEPFRRARPRIQLGNGRTLAFAGVALAILVLVAGGFWYGQDRDLDVTSTSTTEFASGADNSADGIDWTMASPAPGTTDDSSSSVPEWTVDDTGGPDPSDGGATSTVDLSAEPSAPPSATATPEPTLAPTLTPTATPTATPKVSYVLPADVKPALSDARSDMEQPWHAGCLVFETGSTPPKCVYGDPKSDFSVALIGDSHASALFPAVNAIARHHGWRLETYLKVNCPFIDMRVRSLALKREYGECADWRDAVLARLVASPPDLVIVTNARWIHPVLAVDYSVARQGAALARMIARLPGLVVVVADIPAADRDIPACLSAHKNDIRPCAVPRATAFSGDMLDRERLAVRASGARLVNLTKAVCPTDPCPAVVRGMIVLRDTHHLTATFARSLAPVLDQALTAILQPVEAPNTPFAPDPGADRVPVSSGDRAGGTRRRRVVTRGKFRRRR